MMVIFVSQCEKRALKKSRRVLDAFANRIGDNTWQTVITKEGLDSVKKLLRQTASKSTAVSCHWIRSRSRSQLLWIVGNKSKFDERGVVPVNSTNKIVFIGDIEIMPEKIFANTKSQRLDQHLFAVGYLACKIIRRLVPEHDNLAKSVFVAGCWHDIGKIDPPFQDWLRNKLNKNGFEEVPEEGQHIDKKSGKFSWQKHPRHNEISLLFFSLFFNVNDPYIDRAKHAIYWHHAKPIRQGKDEREKIIGVFNKLKNFEQDYPKLVASASVILKSVQTIAKEYCDELPAEIDNLYIPKFASIEDSLETADIPTYKRYSCKESVEKYQNNIQHNALNNLARSALITADRLVSQNVTGDLLNDCIDNHTLEVIIEDAFQKERGLKHNIQDCLAGFNQNDPDVGRNQQQTDAANKLADDEVTIGVLKGPAGCGKTKIALEWALNTRARKMFWVCPRVQVCQGLFFDLISDRYLPEAKIEICTGEIKQTMMSGKPVETPEGQEFSGDIVITTIDQVINSITTHRNVTTLVDFMDVHVVFDEYHEYITMPAFNLLFAELVQCKKYQQNGDQTPPNTLLVSATPHPLFIKEFLQLNEQDIVGVDSFNNSQYRIEFVDYNEAKEDDSNPLFQEQPDNTFIISNTAIVAQKSFIDNQNKENAILLHSKFKKSDRECLFEKVFNAFKEDGSRDYDILRSGPIVQASLNITCDKMVSEMTLAENFLQRLGRLDRFGRNQDVNQYVIAITEDIKRGKSKGSSARFLNSLKSLQSAKAWYEFLESKLSEKPLTINKIYALYDDFYNDASCQQFVEQDLIDALKESVIRLDEKLFDPVTLPSYKKDDGKIKIKKHSLRGDSRFVQMAVLKIIDRAAPPEHKNEYIDDTITYETNKIEGVFFGQKKPEMDLLTFMYNKHHKIQTIKTGKTVRQARSLNILRDMARDPETPIYVSYTIEDLRLCNDTPQQHAVYYAEGIRHPIGAISLTQLNNRGE